MLCSHCTAEELAFTAVMGAARDLADSVGVDADFETYRELHTEDFDVDMLWDMALDGIEDPDPDLTVSPAANLEFDRWFEPFGHVSAEWVNPRHEQ